MKTFNNLKFRTKLWVFAGTMILALLIANGISYVASEITKDSVDDYKDIAQLNVEFMKKERDHLKWVTAQIAQDVSQVNQASTEIAAASNQISGSATELSSFAEKLNEISGKYKT